jgi:hypothetical protein
MNAVMKTIILAAGLLVAACGTPDIEANCTMNGHGSGECSFDNRGRGDGSQDITIAVYRIDRKAADLTVELFSGLVSANDYRTRKFLVSGFQDMCSEPYGSKEIKAGKKPTPWHDICNFMVIKTTTQW